MAQTTCNVCNKNFSSEEELREHQRTAHGGGAGKKEGERSGGEHRGEQPRRDDKIAS
jgi:hypothetical protein